MKKNIQDRWVAALRSGKYGQTKGMLSDGEGNYCCLGVLCELAIEDGVKVKKTVDGRVYYEENTAMPPAPVEKWAGITSFGDWILDDDGDLDDSPDGRGLTGLNDHGKTFAEIADLIEKYGVK